MWGPGGPRHPELAMWCSGPGVPSCIRSWLRRSRQQRDGEGGEGGEGEEGEEGEGERVAPLKKLPKLLSSSNPHLGTLV